MEKTPGAYDLFVSLAKGSLIAGASDKAYIYAGLETGAEFTFTDADFVQTVYLQGSVTLPAGVDADGITGGIVNAYSDAAYSGQIGTAEVSAGTTAWVVGVPGTGTGPAP